MDRLGLIAILAVAAGTGLVAHATAGWYGRSKVRQRASAGACVDPVTSTEATWSHRLGLEQRRHQRYGRQATIVAMHLGGATGPLGCRAARRRAQDVRHARRIQAAVRSTDIVRARSDGIVHILLTETDEDGGNACVHRLAERLPAWDAEMGATTRLTAAWASVRAGHDLPTANRLAMARLGGVQAGWLRSQAVYLDAGDVSRTAPGQALRGSRS